MAEVWVVDASPVILLGQVGLLDLLDRLPDSLILPHPVATEVLAGLTDDPARIAVAGGWAKRQTADFIDPSVVEWGLGAGESSVIAIALKTADAVALLDDRLARSAAIAHGLPILGTAGVVVRAKRAQLITSARDTLDALQNAGLYLRPAVRESALRLAGES